MERQDGDTQTTTTITKPSEQQEFVLQWGKRLRCVRLKKPKMSGKSAGTFRRQIISGDPFSRVPRVSEERPVASPERCYPTRGASTVGEESGGRTNMEISGGVEGQNGNIVWPKLYITLSSKEKEEDFLAMKGCKLPQRPKKRAKFVQRTLLLVSPGAWLSDMCQERYEVREKKTPKKRPRGLKAMGGLDSDSE